MAGRARSGGQTSERQGEAGTKVAERPGDGGTTAEAAPSAARIDLPFVTAEFRVPDVHMPTRDDLGAAARGAWSLMPRRSSMLFYGGLAVTAVAGAIEWPVAAAIGVGSALASRGAADPEPRGGMTQLKEAVGQAEGSDKSSDKSAGS